MKSILVAVDFTDVTSEVLSVAVELGRAFNAEINVVHVSEPNPDFVGYEAGPKSVRDAEARHLMDEHRQLHEAAEKIRSEGLEARGHVLQGSTVEKILGEVDRLGADLIVMGNHQHGPLHRFFLGSATEGVIRQNRCPVLVVPSKG
jgi:nucleotide-binding universal stress UspA family protein